MSTITPEQVQWRNITKVVRGLADLCFGSKDHPQYGTYWIAIVNSLTAKDGLNVTLEKLPISDEQIRMVLKAFEVRYSESDWATGCEALRSAERGAT